MPRRGFWRALAGVLAVTFCTAGTASAAPAPMLSAGHSVTWWFVYKFNAETSHLADPHDPLRVCPFGGTREDYGHPVAQAYAVASSADPVLKPGPGLVGTSDGDPVGTTFGAIYKGALSYVVWNDQYYFHPDVFGCGKMCGKPWAHAKGVLAWDDQGAGVVMQVTTPSWPAAGSGANPRDGDGNTLGCIDDDNVWVAQHFFALKLSRADTAAVLRGLVNAGVVAKPGFAQLVSVRAGSPLELAQIAAGLGDNAPAATKVLHETLSSGIQLISKPAVLHVPPWQLVSATLGGEPLKVASWWTGKSAFPSTKATKPGCWDPGLSKPGKVQIAITGRWQGQPIGLAGGASDKGNHAKVGVSLPGGHDYAVFGDMNQTGGLSNLCTRSQNPRGGLFFAVQDAALASSVRDLLDGLVAAEGTATVEEGAAPWAPAHSARRRR